MELKNKYKKVENYLYSVAEVVLVAKHSLDERGVFVRLVSRYKLAYTDDDSLLQFVSSRKKDPIKYYRSKFCFNAPISTKVFINPVSKNNYSFGKCTSCKGYMLLSECTDLHIHDLFKHNRNLTQYQPNINSL